MTLRELFKTLVGMGIFLVVVSLIELRLFPDSTNVSIGITTGVISGMFVLIFQKAILERGEVATTSALPVADTPGTPTIDENRELTYSNIILSYVATIVALAALGNDIYSRSGLPLLHLWAGTMFLLFGGISTIYWRYKFGRNIFALLIGIVCFIGSTLIFFLILLSILNGIHTPPQISGNVTNICDNCTYPVTNINTVNNYNITLYENYTGTKNPAISVSELKNLMQNR
jgi:hypothetical protein